MAKARRMSRNVGKGKDHDEGRKVNLPPFAHAVDKHGNVFCSLPDMDRVYPRYHTLSELEDAWRWRDTDCIKEQDLVLLSKEMAF